MAWWTRIIAIWTAIGAVLLFFALILTLMEIEGTRKIGEAQIRAFVGVEDIFLTSLKQEWSDTRLLQFGTKNYGHSPAQNVEVGTKSFIDDVPQGWGDILHDFGIIEPEQSQIGLIAVPKSLAKEIIAGNRRLRLRVFIRYDDIFGWRHEREAEYYPHVRMRRKKNVELFVIGGTAKMKSYKIKN